jgi:hypothetical protein
LVLYKLLETFSCLPKVFKWSFKVLSELPRFFYWPLTLFLLSVFTGFLPWELPGMVSFLNFRVAPNLIGPMTYPELIFGWTKKLLLVTLPVCTLGSKIKYLPIYLLTHEIDVNGFSFPSWPLLIVLEEKICEWKKNRNFLLPSSDSCGMLHSMENHGWI